jgi:hypothetical protein
MGFEPTTLTLARLHSTTELFPPTLVAYQIFMEGFFLMVNRVFYEFASQI